MKAPIYAYVVGEDNNFLKVVTRDSSGVYRSFVARFLRGSRAEGGYSESPADMIDDIKALFRLDDLLLVRQKQSDGGMKVMGFVGMVRTDGPWAEYHNMDKRSAGVASGRDGRTYVCLNDAGLNILPHVVLEAVATWANWTRTLTGTIAFLAALNFDAFIPVSSVTSTPDMSSSGIKTFLIDSVAVDEILNTVKGMSASSLPVAIAFMQGDDNVALLGDGRTSGEASDSFLEAYYNYVKNGTGSYTKAPDGLWVCETMKTAYNGAIRVDLYYGIQIQSGRIRGVFRAKTPQMPDTRPDLRLNINIVSQGNNKYHVSLSLVAAGDTDGAGEATVTINGLHVRQSQTGPSMEGQFTTGTGAMVTFPQTMTYGGRFQIILVFILTTRLTSFWVTADAVCSNSKYKFSNPGGQSGSGGSVVVPTT